jgi:hypothetical protein
VIPGVGTLRKEYKGPNFELTRTWVVNPVDSIGNVNGEVRYGFDVNGRMKAEMSLPRFGGHLPEPPSWRQEVVHEEAEPTVFQS